MWVEVGIDTAGLPALDKFDSRHYFRRERNLLEADLTGDRLDLLLLRRVGVRVHEHYGEACDDALRLDPREVLSDFGQVELTFYHIVLVVVGCDNLRFSFLFFLLILALLLLLM